MAKKVPLVALGSSAWWNFFLTILALVAASGFGWHFVHSKDQNVDAWPGVGQSLIAAACVGVFSTIGAAFTYFLSHRPYEAMFDAGVRRVFPRGRPGHRWRVQLKSFSKEIVFYGKDHNRLFKDNRGVLRQALVDGKSLTFYLLALSSTYYANREDERKDRLAAGDALYKLADELKNEPGNPADRLHLFEFRDEPTFSCRLIDQETIVFGPYLPDVPNEATLEFEIEKGGEMYDACRTALERATAGNKRAPLQRPEPTATE